MLKSFRLIVIRGLLSGVLIIFSVAPLSATLASADDECTPPESSQPGVRRPVGADAALYHYDCDSGLWVSSRYTYNPATGRTAPNETPVYTYNSATGKYDTQTWIYSAPKGDYVLVNSAVDNPPAGAQVVGGPSAAASSDASASGGGTGAAADSGGSGSGGTNNISNTGTDSNNTIDSTGNGNLTLNNDSHLDVANLLNATAASGNATVIGNTIAGDATSGDADNVHNIVNLLQSTSDNLGSGNVVTFVYDIDGDVNGDLLFDPNALGAVQPASTQPDGNSNLTINNSVDAAINNDINIHSQTGDATVSENTEAGDATSGSARAIANVVNMINSAISSGQSFIGTININGNLNGDILLPPDFVDQLIAANVPQVNIIMDTGAGSNNTINDNHNADTNISNTNDLGINNNVDASAQSGNASVSQNTSAGGATTGNATNSITAFNLTGSNFIGSNAILVFVNVTGKWVGLIVNAPQGATAAAIGGGGNSISTTGAGSNNTINDGGSSSTDINNNTKQRITNNIHISALSGDASVSRNTKAGDAKSGDANTAVNLMNLQNSSLALSNWFGILFINVFGTWNGSFGVNTSAGDPVAMAEASGGANGPAIRAFGFVPSNSGGSGGSTSYNLAPYAGDQYADMHTASNSVVPTGIGSQDKGGGSDGNAISQGQVNWPLILGSSTLFGFYLLGDKYGANLRRTNLKLAMRFRSFL